MNRLQRPDWTPYDVNCTSPSGAHRMRVWSLGDPDSRRVVVCVHGLTRSAQDFGPLARQLAEDAWVLCPDVVGRGGSDWLQDPQHYHVGQYAVDMGSMAQQLGLAGREVSWVGTSMGGLIGLIVAGQAFMPVRRMVLNDVGALVAGGALGRIGAYLTLPTGLASWEDALQQVRRRFAGFGPHTDEEWEFLARAVVVEGGLSPAPAESPQTASPLRFHHDPEIAAVFRAGMAAQEGDPPDLDLWPLYDPLRLPVLLIRGALSDLLTAESAQEMTERGPEARLVTLPGIGHAPSLIKQDQIDLIDDFLTQGA